MLETERVVIVLVALPGVEIDERRRPRSQGDDSSFPAHATYPPEMRTATIHRLELPQGRFERRIRLPPGRYAAIERATSHGCLVVTLQEVGGRAMAEAETGGRDEEPSRRRRCRPLTP